MLGLAGHALRRAGSVALGWGADALPAAALCAGVVLVAGRARRGAPVALAGVAALGVLGAGLGDLAGGNPSLHAAARALGGAGGIVGAALGGGLRSLLGTAGAALLLAAAALVASGPVTGLALRSTLTAPWSGARGLWRWLGGGDDDPAPSAAEAARILRRAAGGVEVGDWAREHAAPGPVRRSARAVAVPAASDDEPLVPLTLDHTLGLAPVPIADPPAPDPPGVAADAVPAEADPPAPAPPAGRAEQLGFGVVPAPSHWKLPPARLLARGKEQDLDKRAVEERGRVLERALAAHGVETRLVGFTVGPTVTRFELELGPGVKVARVTSLAKDIAYAMASADVRILAPIPGRSAIGVEVPNKDRQLVTLGDVLASPDARRAEHPLEVGIGRDIAGRAVMVNLAQMPHLLIAGATGAGKSSCINSIITSVTMRATPEQVRLILVDPKRVELGQYSNLPHLLTPVVVNPKRAANALGWAVAEMERRYDLLAEAGMRDVTGYNAAVDRGDFAEGPLDDEVEDVAPPTGDAESAPPEEGPAPPGTAAAAVAEARRHAAGERSGPYQRLPYILVIVDELNDLMMVAARDVEESICRLAQMARAVGIHLVIATQRPSVDVITGVIKANIPSRLAFSVSSLADSRVILDQPGAERLVGRGDLLLLTASSSVPRRLQCPWVSEEEVRAVVAHWRRQSAPNFVEGVVGEEGDAAGSGVGDGDDDDELLRQAMELVVRSQLGSTSMLQRKLRVGFARAGRLMDLLERRGVVGPSEGSKARAVLMTPDELDSAAR